MKKFFSRFKHRKPIVYISGGFYVLLLLLIVIESSLDASASGMRSNWFANISAWFVNLFNGPQSVEVIKPTSIELVSDTTVLRYDEEGIRNYALGTTSRVIYEATYPNKKNSNDTYDIATTITHISGNQDDYNVVRNQTLKDNKLTIVLYVETKDMSSSTYSFKVDVAEKVNKSYTFRVVDRAAPTDFEATINKDTLKINETATIFTKLNGDNRGNWFLNRYYDVSLISRSSTNEGVATIDSNGVVHAHSSGVATIKYGDKEFNVTVTNEVMLVPSSNQITLTISDSGNNSLHIRDYDYVFNGEEDEPDDYSVIIYPTFLYTSLEDQSVTYEVDDYMKALISPYSYDDNGYPVYEDEEHHPCVRVSGYRKSGNVTLTCISNVDNSIRESIVFSTSECVPTELVDINVKDGFKIYLGAQQNITATSFIPKNTTNTKIHVSCNDEAAISITNNDSGSVIIKAEKEGSYLLTVSSVANPSLTKTVSFTIEAVQVINDDNFTDFAKFMRKFGGHMGLFLVTTVVGFIFWILFYSDHKQKLLISLGLAFGVSFLFAGLSELIQAFIPSRAGMWRDVGIDMIGASVGILISLALFGIVLLFKKLKKEKKDATK